jgi:hypothetical protein
MNWHTELLSLLWANPVYRMVLIFIGIELMLLGMMSIWLMVTALFRLYVFARQVSFKERLANTFFTKLNDEAKLEQWIGRARRYPERILRGFLEPRARGTTGVLQEQIVDVYARLGLLDTDCKHARSVFWHRRIQAMRRLAFFAGPQHRQLLVERGRDTHSIRILAALALGRVGSADEVVAVLKDLDLPRRIMEQPVYSMLSAMEGDRLAEVMGKWSAVLSPSLRRILLEVAAHRAPEICEGLLAIAGADVSLEVRSGAARAAAKLGSKASFDLLLELANDERFEVRAGVFHSLGTRGSKRAIEPLLKGTRDDNFWVRQSAAAALLEIGEDGRKALKEVSISSTDRFARDAARQELERYQLFLDAKEMIA